ncbi:unnamed protein product [Didymodactylos carnosus]|uniref:BRCT domain-containing protein n=1 Tax=Didymodactylos carnosus TaxID=1234261 RepID=A0A8S2V6W5_9BILA|nr:unnamed protein product [Didymodactylos carnosus]CAF4374884.1 unnamed protein product [Didymodactylos carnosus]
MISLLPVVKSAPAECGWNDCNEEIDVSDEDNEFEMLSKAGSSHSKQELDLSPQKIVDMFGDRLSGHSTRTKVVNHDKVDTKVEQQQQMVISISNLNAEQISKIEQFLRQFKISRPISDIINETTTHLITDELDMQPLVCTLTKNVVRAITRHLNIVCYRWIIDCLRHGRIIDCEQYEICGDTLISSQHNGPRISRLNENNLLFPVNIFGKYVSYYRR